MKMEDKLMKKTIIAVLTLSLVLFFGLGAGTFAYAATDDNSASSKSSLGDPADALYKEGRQNEGKGAYDNALDCYTRAYALGSSDAAYRLGRMFLYGNGINADSVYAVVLFNAAYEMGNPDGLCGFGQCLEELNEYEEAYKYFEKAANEGSINALNCIGEMYAYGRYVGKDQSQAVKNYKEAAEQGNEFALRNLGICYAYKWGVEKDLKEALKNLQKAADAGNTSALYDIASIYYDEEDYQKALDYYKQAADRGNVDAMNKLGDLYGPIYRVEEVIDQDYNKARKYYEMAAEKGSGLALNRLGDMTERGLGLGKPDYELAKNYYEKGMETGDAYWAAASCLAIGQLYDMGRVGEHDDSTAYYYYRKAAEMGNITAPYNVAKMYEYGKGVKQDIELAKIWYKRAYDMGVTFADEDYERLVGNSSSDASTGSESSVTENEKSTSDASTASESSVTENENSTSDASTGSESSVTENEKSITAGDIAETAGDVADVAGAVNDIAGAFGKEGLENASGKVEDIAKKVNTAARIIEFLDILFGD
ncbi:MAG: hypothetical protein K5985_03005 [Lachnospiraceae bacterium]|nr:hypothetical protein [Lachnospiraceae bacterium]